MTSHAAAAQAKRAKKRDHPALVTANRLSDGMVVYLTEPGDWVEDIAQAHVIGVEDDIDAFVALGQRAAAARLVVDVYPIPVEITGEGAARRVSTLSVRERIRAAGPTVRTDLGKQAAPA